MVATIQPQPRSFSQERIRLRARSRPRTRESAYPRFPQATLGSRLYSPALGRWLSRDPISEPAVVNSWQFVNNSPPSWVDRRGEISEQTALSSDTSEPEPPTEAECTAQFGGWYGKGSAGITDMITCETEYTDVYSAMPSVVQACTQAHEAEHVSVCKGRNICERLLAPLDPAEKPCGEYMAYSVSVQCAENALLVSQLTLTDDEKMALKCYLRAVKGHKRRNKVECDVYMLR